MLRSDLELARIETEHLRNALETMRTEHEGQEAAARVRMCIHRYAALIKGAYKTMMMTALKVSLLNVLLHYLNVYCNYFNSLKLMWENFSRPELNFKGPYFNSK